MRQTVNQETNAYGNWDKLCWSWEGTLSWSPMWVGKTQSPGPGVSLLPPRAYIGGQEVSGVSVGYWTQMFQCGTTASWLVISTRLAVKPHLKFFCFILFHFHLQIPSSFGRCLKWYMNMFSMALATPGSESKTESRIILCCKDLSLGLGLLEC